MDFTIPQHAIISPSNTAITPKFYIINSSQTYQKRNKITVISHADTIPNPGTMMIEPTHTTKNHDQKSLKPVTGPTVVTARRHVNMAETTTPDRDDGPLINANIRIQFPAGMHRIRHIARSCGLRRGGADFRGNTYICNTPVPIH